LLELRARRVVLAIRQAKRLAAWAAWPAPRLADEGSFPHRVYVRAIPIARDDDAAHPLLERGKLTNLALAAPCFDGIIVSPDAPLSFWRALGRVTAARGFEWGMELRAGCIVPALGGGICLLSNALFEMAARLGWTIVERHGHSLDAGLPSDGLDATVLWPHVDLRVAPRSGEHRLAVNVREGRLHLDVHARERSGHVVHLAVVAQPAPAPYRASTVVRTIDGKREVIARNNKRVLRESERSRNCLTCDETACHARVAIAK
jgi:vancomycin resistance protein VanW